MNFETHLSESGARRREEMLPRMLDEAGRLRRRRQTVRAGGAALACALLLGVFLRFNPLPGLLPEEGAAPREIVENPRTPAVESPRDDAAPQPTPHKFVQIVETDPSLLAKYLLPMANESRVRILSDDALLAELAALGRPSGLVRSGGRVWVVAHHDG